MVHIFMLVVVLGTGEFRKELPNPMYFYNINECLYFAKKIPLQYGNYSYSSRIDPKDRIIESFKLRLNETIKRCENSEQIVSEMTNEYNNKSLMLQPLQSKIF